MASNPHVMECPHGQCTTTTHTQKKRHHLSKTGSCWGCFFSYCACVRSQKWVVCFARMETATAVTNTSQHYAAMRKITTVKKKRKRMGKLLGIDTKQMHSLYSSYHENWQPMSLNFFVFVRKSRKRDNKKLVLKEKKKKKYLSIGCSCAGFSTSCWGGHRREQLDLLFYSNEKNTGWTEKNHVFLYYLTCIFICQIGFENERSEGCSTFPRPPEEQLYIFVFSICF